MEKNQIVVLLILVLFLVYWYYTPTQVKESEVQQKIAANSVLEDIATVNGLADNNQTYEAQLQDKINVLKMREKAAYAADDEVKGRKISQLIIILESELNKIKEMNVDIQTLSTNNEAILMESELETTRIEESVESFSTDHAPVKNSYLRHVAAGKPIPFVEGIDAASAAGTDGSGSGGNDGLMTKGVLELTESTPSLYKDDVSTVKLLNDAINTKGGEIDIDMSGVDPLDTRFSTDYVKDEDDIVDSDLGVVATTQKKVEVDDEFEGIDKAIEAKSSSIDQKREMAKVASSSTGKASSVSGTMSEASSKTSESGNASELSDKGVVGQYVRDVRMRKTDADETKGSAKELVHNVLDKVKAAKASRQLTKRPMSLDEKNAERVKKGKDPISSESVQKHAEFIKNKKEVVQLYKQKIETLKGKLKVMAEEAPEDWLSRKQVLSKLRLERKKAHLESVRAMIAAKRLAVEKKYLEASAAGKRAEPEVVMSSKDAKAMIKKNTDAAIALQAQIAEKTDVISSAVDIANTGSVDAATKQVLELSPPAEDEKDVEQILEEVDDDTMVDEVAGEIDNTLASA